MADTIDKIIDELENGKANLRVHLVVPPTGDNPWRTKNDYDQEQKEARERHSMFQEQHKLLTRSARLNIVAVTAAVLSAFAAIYSAYYVTTNREAGCTHKKYQQPAKQQEQLPESSPKSK